MEEEVSRGLCEEEGARRPRTELQEHRHVEGERSRTGRKGLAAFSTFTEKRER